jgi:hypothetical protein
MYNTPGREKARSTDLQLRHLTRNKPWVPIINALQNAFRHIRFLTNGYEAADKCTISLASTDFAKILLF